MAAKSLLGKEFSGQFELYFNAASAPAGRLLFCSVETSSLPRNLICAGECQLRIWPKASSFSVRQVLMGTVVRFCSD